MCACNQRNEYLLQNEKVLKQHFSEEETTNLSQLVSKFEAIIIETPQVSFKSTIYLQHFEQSRKCTTALSYFEQIKDLLPNSKLLISKNLSDELVAKIWTFDKKTETYHLKYKGEYFNFLKQYASETNDPVLTEYINAWEIAGDLSPSMLSLIQKNMDQLKLEDKTVRLILAIHFISLANQHIVF